MYDRIKNNKILRNECNQGFTLYTENYKTLLKLKKT